MPDTAAEQSLSAPAIARARWSASRVAGWLLALAAGIGTAWLAYWWTERVSIERLRVNGAQRLDVYAKSLDNLLDKYEFLPRLLELNKDVIALLQDPDNPALRRTVNEYLERVNRQAGSRTIYIVNLQGVTQATSNWRSSDSFIGDNVSFRPYVQDALRGAPGGFYGVGTTRLEPGYFFAHGIYLNGRMLGVATVKVNIESQQRDWVQGNDQVMLTDANGVVFLTSVPAWKYKTLAPLAGAVREHLQKTRQYHSYPLEPLDFAHESMRDDGTRIVAIRRPGDPVRFPGPARMLAQTRSLAPRNWQFIYLSDLGQARANAQAAAVFSCVAFGFLLMLFLYMRQRQRSMAQRLQAKADLQNAYNNLEAMVAERTSSLNLITKSLSEEIEVRRKAEQLLHLTQNELFQAGKMAVLGQMSASITHELNQPLTALRTMSDNAVILFERGRMDEVKANLQRISQIVARMGGITGKLKIFARKSNTGLSAVSVHTAVQNALVLIERRLELDKVEFRLHISNEDVYALCDSNRLEQVLLNLLTNALDSMAGSTRRRLTLDVYSDKERVVIRVADTGPGLTDEARARLFEPFYTTKPQGQGLGLGLAISEQIVREFGGLLKADEVEEGARFVIELKTAQQETA
ncbi:ATP-binding protein [Massilia sp. erpn]|uniref:sensor histidine kinase n=1 Tax=Massilia sp. erpn TaxID=2738142 RepID=UPI0021050F2C|nr:ATP-binding protein [Massilia sp. erpn]UTY58681.1 sensor histidine kinase [Massilia sp. erpn]